jgi:hypothetical protein
MGVFSETSVDLNHSARRNVSDKDNVRFIGPWRHTPPHSTVGPTVRSAVQQRAATNRTIEMPAHSTARVYRSLGRASYWSGDTQMHGFASYWGTSPPESDPAIEMNGKTGKIHTWQGQQRLWQIWGDLWSMTPWGLVDKYRFCREVWIQNLYYRTLKKAIEIYSETVLPVDQTTRCHSQSTAAFVWKKITIYGRKLTYEC